MMESRVGALLRWVLLVSLLVAKCKLPPHYVTSVA